MSNIASPEWTKQLSSALQSSSDVRAAAATWTHGPIALNVNADEERSFAGATVVLEVRDGSVSAAVGPQLTPFSFSGSLDRWQAVFSGTSTMVDAALESKLHVRGDLPSLQRHRGLLDAIASVAGGLTTTWPEAPAKA